MSRAVFIGAIHLVIPAAGIGAGALVRIAVVEVAGQQAASGIGDAQRAVDEYFEFDVRALLAYLFDLVQRQFARQDHARQAERFPEFHRRVVDGVGLHRKMDRHFRPAFAHHRDQAGVGHDQRVRLHGDDRLHVRHVGLHLGVVRHQVAGDEQFLAQCVCFLNADAQLFQFEFVVARTQRVARLSGVHRIRAEGVGGAHLVEGAGGQ